jgi:Zn-dependent metalloprotease
MKAHVVGFPCFTPPHMLERIIEAGSQGQKDRALKVLTLSAQMRGRRQSLIRIKFPFTRTLSRAKMRLIYSAGFGPDLPGSLVRSEGGSPSADPAVNEAYNGAGTTYDLFLDQYGRDSVDGKGMQLISSVHYQKGYDNAFWNGEQMVYGDGDEDLPENERLFNRFTVALDVIGHELTHGITQFEAKLAYWEQSGSLNESFSDVFGSLVKQKKLNQTADQADWLIGEGLFTARVNGKAIRSMKEPGTAYDDPLLGKDPQPAHMRDYLNTASDNGGVHINSGIPNKAFYLAAIEIGGYAWEKAGKIWYICLRDKLREKSGFQDAANHTWAVAGDLYGRGSAEQKAVQKGWEGVGIQITSSSGNFRIRLRNWLMGKKKN